MKAIALAVCVLGCGAAPSSGDDTTPPGDGNTAQPDADPACTGSNVMDISGPITADATWSGTINVTAATNIASGVTVTVMPGTVLLGGVSGKLTVVGTLAIAGSRACPVSARASGVAWGGITVANGGHLTASYLDQTGGNIILQGTAAVTLVDSRMSNTTHDLIVMSGGTLDVEYSWLGVEVGQPDTTHCDLHLAGTVPISVKVTHTNLSTAVFAMMLYNGTGLDLTYNNWFGNNRDVDTDPMRPASADASFGWFEAGAPPNPGMTANNLSAIRLTDAGPR